ncbi:MAG: fluoride efflux transporter CrcB [Chloroflexota bacterium]
MRDLLLIALGAMFGANARYVLATYFTRWFGPEFPYGTLFINITGSLLLGFVLTYLANRVGVDTGYRLLIGTGFMGAYTTFSTFSFETIALMQRGDWVPAIVNSAASLVGALLACYVGVAVASWMG